ncbi:MAG: peptidoglycan editing factor PgeF [Jiangellaceae bacterium]
MLRHDEDADGVRFAFTGRSGGVSAEPFAEFNLGGHVGDDNAAVTENRRRVAHEVGLEVGNVLYLNQVHGAAVAVVDGPWPGPAPDVDAAVTQVPGLALAVLVADCVPVLLADAEAGVIGVAHAGRKGLVAGVIPAVLAAMGHLGAMHLRARIGPSVCGRCYEVPAAMRAAVAGVEPAAAATSRTGTPALDVAAGVEAQLRRGGADVVRLDGCTREDRSLYSYRRDRTTGRFAGLVWLPDDSSNSGGR